MRRVNHPFLARILAGEDVPMSEIKRYNASQVEARVAAFDASPCRKAGGTRACPSKNCAHGLERELDLAFARTLRAEAAAS